MNISTNNRRDDFIVFQVEKIDINDNVFSNFVSFNFKIFDFKRWRYDSNDNVWRLLFKEDAVDQIYVNFNIETNVFQFSIDKKRSFDFYINSIAKFIININVFWKIDNKSDKRKSEISRKLCSDVCKKLSIDKLSSDVCKRFSINKWNDDICWRRQCRHAFVDLIKSVTDFFRDDCDDVSNDRKRCDFKSLMFWAYVSMKTIVEYKKLFTNATSWLKTLR